MFKTNKLTAHLLAASVAGLLGACLIGQVFAQEENDTPPAAQQNADQQPQDNAAEPAPQSDAEQNDAAKDAPVADDAPPAVPSDKQLRDDRRDDTRRNDIDDRVSPSDRTLNRDDVRNDVRRFDYDDPSQPIPEQQAYAHQDSGCHPCGVRRVYYNPCGGCGGWNGNWSSGSTTYQTQSQHPSRPVLGITIRNDRDGVQVASVAPNSPAAHAGVRGGDRIVAIDGNDLRDSQQLMSRVRGMQSGNEIALTVDRDGERHELNANLGTYAQVFGDNRGRSSEVPAPPQDRFAQHGEPRTALRPDYEEASNDQDRLDRVQQRIAQLERELTALRGEEQDLRNVVSESKNAEPQPADDINETGETTADDITPPADAPTPADEGDPGNVDNQNDSGASNDVDAAAETDEASPPDDRERLAPSAR